MKTPLSHVYFCLDQATNRIICGFYSPNKLYTDQQQQKKKGEIKEKEKDQQVSTVAIN